MQQGEMLYEGKAKQVFLTDDPDMILIHYKDAATAFNNIKKATIENKGVQPDIEVQNLPQDVAKGKDAQLERGIAEVLKLHEINPPIVPKWGPVRPRGRDAFRDELTASPSGNTGTATGAR